MKKKTIYILMLLAIPGITLLSCKKFLEKEPIGRIGKQILFEDVNGAKLALNGSYNMVLSYYKSDFGMYADVASDNLLRSTKASILLPQFNFQSTSGDDELAVGSIWLGIFKALNNINNVINAIPELKTKFPNENKKLDSINGQALVLRALCHFDLSRVYAQPYNFTPDASHLGVPVVLKTPSPGQNIERKTMRETYDQIITDINNALPILQVYNNRSAQATISYQAALALLSRIYLYKGDWTQSIATANMVINDGNYTLATAAGYKSAFLTYAANNANPKVEIIFQLSNAGLPLTSSMLFSIFSDAQSGQYVASSKIKTLFDADDIRATQMFTFPASGENTGKSLTKKYGDGVVNVLNPVSLQLIRLSELYLNRAEAKWNLGQYAQAAEDLLIIAQRAHPTQTITINYSSNADLYKQIADERNRELCFENHRLFDIIRRKENLQRAGDCNATICSLSYPNDKFILPIPSKEVEANKGMQQNPGYN